MTDTPIINTFSQLAPIIIQKYENYLPTAFDNSLSLLQKVNKIIQAISTSNDTVNSVIDQWNTLIVPYVNGNGFQTDVNNKLDSMASDGTLSTLINQDILGSKASLFVSTTEPTSKDQETFWYKDLGNSSVNFNPDEDTSASVFVGDTEPTNSTLWYDTLGG